MQNTSTTDQLLAHVREQATAKQTELLRYLERLQRDLADMTTAVREGKSASLHHLHNYAHYVADTAPAYNALLEVASELKLRAQFAAFTA